MRRFVELFPPIRKWLEETARRLPVNWSGLGVECEPLSLLSQQTLGLPTQPGNQLELIDQWQEVFRQLVEDINQAQETCHLVFYIWQLGGSADDVAEALVRASARGVVGMHVQMVGGAIPRHEFLDVVGPGVVRRDRTLADELEPVFGFELQREICLELVGLFQQCLRRQVYLPIFVNHAFTEEAARLVLRYEEDAVCVAGRHHAGFDDADHGAGDRRGIGMSDYRAGDGGAHSAPGPRDDHQPAAVQVLRLLHEKRSVEPLIQLLQREDLGRLRDDTHIALKSLTGQKHGPYFDPWNAWWVEDGDRFTLPAKPVDPTRPEEEPGVTFYGDSRVVYVSDGLNQAKALAADLPATWVSRSEMDEWWGPPPHHPEFERRRPDGALVADDGRVARCFEAILAANGLTPRPDQIEAIRGRSKKQALQKLLAARDSNDDYLEGVRGIYAFDLGQIARRDSFATYAFGWSAWHLTEELQQAGFRDIEVGPPQTHGRPWRDIRLQASK